MRFQTSENQENMISVWFYPLTNFLKKKVPFGYSGPASSPVVRDHWVIFEFKIIKESGDEGSDGKGRKSEGPFPSLSVSFPSLPARALRSFPSSLSRASREFPNPHLAFVWGEGGGRGSALLKEQRFLKLPRNNKTWCLNILAFIFPSHCTL